MTDLSDSNLDKARTIVWELTVVEGWDKRLLSFIHYVREDNERTYCGVPIPHISLVRPEAQTQVCQTCVNLYKKYIEKMME